MTDHPLGTIYHHSSWLKVLRATYPQLSLAAFALMDGNNRLRSALLFSLRKKKALSMAFTPFCAPLADNRDDMARLVNKAVAFVDGKSASYYELRTLESNGGFRGSRLAVSRHHDKNHILRLTGGIEKVQSSFHPSQVNKAIRKARRIGVTVREGVSDGDLNVFFQLYGRTRKELGLPIPPAALFRNMWQYMYPRQLTLYIAEHERRPVGTLLTLRHGDTVSLEYLGYDKRELHLRGNHLLYFTAIEKACREGYATVDFRKTPASNVGLLEFKRRWGTQERDISYYYYPSGARNGSNGNGLFKRKLFSLITRPLPFVLAKQLGRVVYRHMG